MRRLSVALGLLLSAVPLVVSAQTTATYTERDLDTLATGNITLPSLGEFNNETVIRQSSRNSAGAAGGVEMWRWGNGLVLEGSYTPTDSKLFALNKSLLDEWTIDRYKTDAIYEHRFWRQKTFQPYLGGGAFMVLLWGGSAPAHSGANASGLDAFGGVVSTVGADIRLSSVAALKLGVLVDTGKASSYGDPTYRASQNLMFEPQVGLVWCLKRTAR